MKRKIKLIFLSLLLVFLISTNKTLKAENSEAQMLVGASIRVFKGELRQGLKFSAKLTGNKNTAHGFYLVYGKTTEAELLTALSSDNPQINDKEVFKVEVSGVNNDHEFSVVLVGIPEAGYLDEISVYAYAGEIVNSKGVVRSVAEVALNLIQAGETDEAYNNILSVIPATIILKVEDDTLYTLENKEDLILPKIDAPGYFFHGWAPTINGQVIYELDFNKSYLLFAVLEEKKSAVKTFLQDLIADPDFSFIKPGHLQIEFKDVYWGSAFITLYNMQINEDLSLDKASFIKVEDDYTDIYYADGNYIYYYTTDYDGDDYLDIEVGSLDHNFLEMFLPFLTYDYYDENFLTYFPSSPFTANEFIKDNKDKIVDYLENNDLFKNMSLEKDNKQITLTLTLDQEFIFNNGFDFTLFDNYSSYNEIEIILVVDNNKFLSMDVNFFHNDPEDDLYFSFVYLDYDLKEYDFVSLIQKEIYDELPYLTINVHLEEEVTEYRLSSYLASSIQYENYFPTLVYKPGYEVEGLYLDNNYTQKFSNSDYEDGVNIYVKLVPKKALQDYLDDFNNSDYVILHTNSKTYYETFKYKMVMESSGYNEDAYYIYDKEDNLYYHARVKKDYEGNVTEKAYILDFEANFLDFMALLDNNYIPLKEGYLLLDSKLIINNHYVYVLEEKTHYNYIIENNDDGQVDHQDYFNNICECFVNLAVASKIEQIYLSKEYFDLSNFEENEFSIFYEYYFNKTVTLATLVNKLEATYTYSIDENLGKITLQITIGEDVFTLENLNYLIQDKGLLIKLNYGTEELYYSEIDELPVGESRLFQKFAGYTFRDDNYTLHYIETKEDLLVYQDLKYVYLEELYLPADYSDLITNLKGLKLELWSVVTDDIAYYDVNTRTYLTEDEEVVLTFSDYSVVVEAENSSLTIDLTNINAEDLITLKTDYNILPEFFKAMKRADRLVNDKYRYKETINFDYYFIEDIRVTPNQGTLFVDFIVDYIDYQFNLEIIEE